MASADTDIPPVSGDHEEHPLVVQFAAWMTGSQEAGAAARRAAGPVVADLTARLAALVRFFMKHRGRHSDIDEALGRYDPTAVLDLDHPLLRGDERRLHVLQRELQRTCLTSTLLNVPAGPRAAFVLREILGLPFEQTAQIFTSAEAARTNYQRSLRELEAYLAPMCEHINPRNGCHCSRRLAGALERGFVRWTERSDLTDDSPLESQGHRNVRDLFASLPAPS